MEGKVLTKKEIEELREMVWSKSVVKRVPGGAINTIQDLLATIDAKDKEIETLEDNMPYI